MSAPQSPLVTTFPPSSPNRPHRSFCAAAGRRHEVLEKALEGASAPDKASCPTRSDPYHARMMLEFRKSALLKTRRVLCITFAQPFAHRARSARRRAQAYSTTCHSGIAAAWRHIGLDLTNDLGQLGAIVRAYIFSITMDSADSKKHD